jgi:preprotein translocase subunit SecY
VRRGQFNQYIRVGALFLAIFQGYGIAVGLERVPSLVPEPGLLFRFTTVVSLVAGTMFLIWLGEQIFSRGITDGIWLLLVAGYFADLPASVDHLIKATYSGLPAKVVPTSAAGSRRSHCIHCSRRAGGTPAAGPQHERKRKARGASKRAVSALIGNTGVLAPMLASWLLLPVVALNAFLRV